jgi:hypothetical protein
VRTNDDGHRGARRESVFCGASKLTKEHVFPRWLTQVLGTDVVGPAVTSERTERSQQGKRRQEWAATDVASFTARVICGPCNNGWMSALESRAQSSLTPMIAGHTTTLTPAAQMDLAAWVTMKAFVVEYALNAGNEIVATPDDRRGLMDTGHPLGAVQVRAGAVERDGIPNSVRRIVYNVGSEGGPRGLAACTTFALGCAVLQVCYGLGITIDWRKTSRPGADYVPLNPPCPGNVSWPPPVVLNASPLADWESPIDASNPAAIMAATRSG